MTEKESKINRVFKQGNSLAIVIPRDIAEKLNIEEGTYLRITEKDGNIHMVVV